MPDGYRQESVLVRARPRAVAAAVLVISALAVSVYWTRAHPSVAAAFLSKQPLTITTEQVSRPGAPCPMAALLGADMRRSGSEVVFSRDGHDLAITWPYGTTAWLVNGKAGLFAPDGSLIATEGQTLPDLTGGLGGTDDPVGTDDRFHVCHIGGHS